MAENTADSSPEVNSDSKGLSKSDSLDLNSLSGLNFGPDWVDGKPSKSHSSKRFDDGGGKKGKGRRSGPGSRDGSRDRRSGGRPQREHGDRNQSDSGRYSKGKRDFGQRSSPRPPFEPTVKVDIYPQDEAFDALVNRLRTSARTYQLFEITHLLLDKPDRYVLVVAPKAKRADSDGGDAKLYYSVPGHLPFETEEQAINYVLTEHLDIFFEVEEIEVEPPSGNFQMVNRCTVTGELLGPPNYHRYQEFVQQHYSARISGMSLERFQSKIEGTKEQEDIDAWLESMKKGARYTVKDRQEGEPESFETLEAARHFLISHRKDKVVGSGESVRFAGRDIESMPRGNIRRSVEAYVEQQKHFPLDSANNIRGRLRRHKFAVYKKGTKGVSYVCAVKRKFRDSKTVFTDSIRDLIEFIEKHPEIPASKLPKQYIGVDTEKQKPKELKMKEPDTEAPSVAPETPQVAPVDPQVAPVEGASGEKVDVSDTSVDSDASESSDASNPAVDNSKVDSSTVETSTQATPISELDEEEQKKLNQLMLDLRWLITEGYVTEYGDGKLFAPAPLPEPKKKEATSAATPTLVQSEAEADKAASGKAPKESEPAQTDTHLEVQSEVPKATEPSTTNLPDDAENTQKVKPDESL